MKICIMGTGGLGGFFGGWLAASGVEVSFIARGAHLDAIRANGLIVTSELGTKKIEKVQATNDPTQVGPVDIILFCVKNYDLDAAAELCRPMLKPDTAVISLLNGVSAPDRISQILGRRHAVPGLTLVPSNIASPGVIAHVGQKTDITFGEVDGSQSQRLETFSHLCRLAGLDAQISQDITTGMWSKFVGWSSVSVVAAASRKPFAVIQSTPELLDLFRDLATEAWRVGRAKGAQLPDDLVDALVRIILSYPPEAKPSMLVDLERGNRIELETACGTVVAMGEEMGVDTPINRALHAILLPYKTD
jgi:2-dehydropantoate 2-reductase